MLGGKFLIRVWDLELGDGKSVRFLFDDWVRIEQLWSLFPRLFRVVSYKEASVKDCWHVSCRRVLP